jgi:hypothetical protein
MTQYTVLVHEKGTDGFRFINNAEASNAKQAVEQVLNGSKSLTEGIVVAVPSRSWDPTPFKLVTQPKLELG